MDRERIGKYRIVGELGRGTMGIVYKALDPVLNRHVAIKTVSARTGVGQEALDRFKREAEAAALLNHPNIVTLYDFGEEDGLRYMAMELLEGSDLRDAIDNDRLKTLGEKLEVVDSVLSALDYAHEKGVVHRDVKPANIHLGPDRQRQVKIMDFGLARTNSSEMTQEGIVLGTPNYMSPEQALGDKVDGRSDLFAVGAVLYELLSGHKPFEADSTPSVLFQVVHKEPPPVKRWAPDAPAPLVAIVERALRKDRNKRFATAGEMRAALGSARASLVSGSLQGQSGWTTTAPPAARASGDRSSASQRSARIVARRTPSGRLARAPRWRAAALALLVLALVAGGGAGGWWLWQNRAPARPAAVDSQVGALTQALVQTQVQLGERELEDKNYAAALKQAESALRLAGGRDAAAARLAEQARMRIDELESAVREARAFAARGEVDAASQQLGRVLELDPRHPAASELSARLNSEFRARTEAAVASMHESRSRAAAAGAQSAEEFVAAAEKAREAEAQVGRQEYADAVRTYLEARDGFDRAARGVKATRKPQAASPPPAASAAPSGRTPPLPVEAGRAGPSPSAPPAVPHAFVADNTVVNTRAAGGLRGFDTTDVSSRRTPQFVGRIRFEVTPETVREGDLFTVRVLVVNEGKRGLRLRSLALAVVSDGHSQPVPVSTPSRELPAKQTTLVAEYSSSWRHVSSWAFDVTLTSDRNETVSARLRSAAK